MLQLWGINMDNISNLNVKLLNKNAKLPQRATRHSAGYDLFACIEEDILIKAHSSTVIPTGIAIEIKGGKNTAAFIFARSGLGIKNGITLSNCVGVIDSDFRGEIKVGLTNYSDEDYTIEPAQRIAQMVIMPIYTPNIIQVEELSKTHRGDAGFGSTGKF